VVDLPRCVVFFQGKKLNQIALIISVSTSIFLIVALLVFGRKKPHYSHLRDTISELGEIGAIHARTVSLAVFLPVGLAMLTVAYLQKSGPSLVMYLALSLAAGYIVAAFFPCDVGSPLVGSHRQSMHNLGGTVEYIGGGFALLQLAQTLGQGFSLAGYAVITIAFLLSIRPLAMVRGLLQRVAEAALFGGLTLALWRT
jgi:hypothetical protein